MSILNKKRYIAAVSGGPDSIALLYMYRKYIKAVCTVRYNKRDDCELDVECVKRICDRYKIKHEVLNVVPEVYQKYEHISNFQAKARFIRYDFFVEIAKKYNVKTVLVAHHLDDFLETAYLDYQKKSKKLFYGIRCKSIYSGLEIYRPLINSYRKKTLRRYCDDCGLKYINDKTNDTDIYERNRVRKIINNMNIDEVYSFLKKIRKYNKTNKSKQKLIDKKFEIWEKTNFNIKWFKELDSEIQYYLIYKFLSLNELFRPNQNKINNIINFVLSNNNKSYRLENNAKLTKREKHLSVIKD